MKVLHIDDEPAALEQGKIFLEKMEEDIEVETASSIEEALKVMKNENIDVLVSDLKMPGVTGLDFLEMLKENDIDIPFIVFTGTGKEEQVIEALNLGVDYYLKKGGSPKQLYSVLADYIKDAFKDYSNRIRTLYVDDEPGLLDQARIYMGREEDKIDFYTATSPRAGLEMLKSEDFDVVVSDYEMSEMDGLEFYEELEKRDQDIPFIVFTGKGKRADKKRASKMGVDRFLLKAGGTVDMWDVLADHVKQSYFDKYRSVVNQIAPSKLEIEDMETEEEEGEISVLFVDDEPKIREQAEIFLGEEGEKFDLETASSAEKAMNKLNGKEFNAVVSDLKMPEMDGLDFLRLVRELGMDIPFLIFSGRASKEEALKAKELGADHLILKSEDPETDYSNIEEKVLENVEEEEN